VITPDPAYRPNPERAIYVTGNFNQEMVDRLTPQIIALKDQSADPITAYIDSPGGTVVFMERILSLLTSRDQDLNDSSTLITVVTGRAASAGAEMLSSGDYAVAYPGSSLLYHGARIPEFAEPLTVEWSTLLAEYLKDTNDAYAMRLAQRIISRSMFRFVLSKPKFDSVRQDNPTKKLSDLDCFLILTEERLSRQAKEVLKNTRTRHERYARLLEFVQKRKTTAKSGRDLEAFQIKAIVDFELKDNKDRENWNFENAGLKSVADDFFLLNEYLNNYQSFFFNSLCTRHGNNVLTTQERDDIENAPEAEREQRKVDTAKPRLMPIWSFVFALCHALQIGDNTLTPKDAFYLGLIDEVIGEGDLFPLRWIQEYEPDKPPQQLPDAANDETGEAAPQDAVPVAAPEAAGA
jgi:ATP-dependent protease ClpP protease subunit